MTISRIVLLFAEDHLPTVMVKRLHCSLEKFSPPRTYIGMSVLQQVTVGPIHSIVSETPQKYIPFRLRIRVKQI